MVLFGDCTRVQMQESPIKLHRINCGCGSHEGVVIKTLLFVGCSATRKKVQTKFSGEGIMCQDFSGIITEKGEVLWLPENTADHQKIIAKYNLKETDDSKAWVRFEINYKDFAKISRCREDAMFKWDCQTLPVWAEKKAVDLIAKAWVAWDESRKTAVVLKGETVAEVIDVYIAFCLGRIEYVSGNAQIKYVSENAQIKSIIDFGVAIKKGIIYLAKGAKTRKTGKVTA